MKKRKEEKIYYLVHYNLGLASPISFVRLVARLIFFSVNSGKDESTFHQRLYEPQSKDMSMWEKCTYKKNLKEVIL